MSFLQNYLFKLQRFEINVINILCYQVVVRCFFKGGNYKRRREVFLRRRKLHKNKNTILIRRIGLGVLQPIRSFGYVPSQEQGFSCLYKGVKISTEIVCVSFFGLYFFTFLEKKKFGLNFSLFGKKSSDYIFFTFWKKKVRIIYYSLFCKKDGEENEIFGRYK